MSFSSGRGSTDSGCEISDPWWWLLGSRGGGRGWMGVYGIYTVSRRVSPSPTFEMNISVAKATKTSYFHRWADLTLLWPSDTLAMTLWSLPYKARPPTPTHVTMCTLDGLYQMYLDIGQTYNQCVIFRPFLPYHTGLKQGWFYGV